MNRHLLTAAAILTLTFPGVALASSCPSVAKQVEAALADTTVAPEVKAEAEMKLAEGKELHASGDHSKSMEVLGEAQALLGLE